MAKDNPSRTPQEYEVLSGGGAEAAEMGRQGLTRRQMLRRAVLAGAGLVGAEAFALGMVFGQCSLIEYVFSGRYSISPRELARVRSC